MKDTKTYDVVVNKMREYFRSKGFLEVPVQSRLSILAACEDPQTVASFGYEGSIWPLPQTGQMWLEYELLKNPDWNGCYCISTSYREEKNPIPGRHDKIFPMFEFESKGSINDLRKLNKGLLDHLEIPAPEILKYDAVCEKYGVDILETEHETALWEDVGDSISLEYFPRRTDPFWNMKRNEGDPNLYNKIDVLLYGMETIGSAERATNVQQMREDFYTISNGEYAQLLFKQFGKERVVKELEEYFSHAMIPRFGGGIGLTRMGRAYNLAHGK